MPELLSRAEIPAPPTDIERDSYLGPQRRWLPLAGFISYALVLVSMVNFIGFHLWALWFYIPLSISLGAAFLSLITSSRVRQVSLESHRNLVDNWVPATSVHPSVDVLLPSAGEPLPVLDNTYQHVSRMQWQGELTVYVLDDSARPEVEELVRQHGFTYLSRPNRGELKKAGNLRHGWENSHGEFIVVLDADFVPRPDFITELLPYFDDPHVGIVQSPQFFDIEPTMNWIQRAAASTQVLFYRYIQPSRDRLNAAICVGTSAVYRRASLAKSSPVGGFAQIGHSEDVYTGLNVMAAGDKLRYVPTVVSKGLCPDSFDQFVVQQYRWCEGSMSLLFSKRFHRGFEFTVMQRLCFWAGFLFYIGSALDLLVMGLPTLIMVLFLPDLVHMTNYLFVALAVLLQQSLVPFITGGANSSLVGLLRIQVAFSVAHLVMLWSLVSSTKDEGWVATGATSRSGRSHRIRRTARWWLIGYHTVLVAAILWRVPQYGLDDYWATVAFTLFAVVVSYPVALGSAESWSSRFRPKLTDHEFLLRGRPSPDLSRALLESNPHIPASLRDGLGEVAWATQSVETQDAVPQRSVAAAHS